jgi:GntR family transcriptional regulator
MPKMKHQDISAGEAVPARLASLPLPFKSLDKSSYTPMYAQIQSQLLAMIRSGRLSSGDLLPSEEELSRVYSVSRMTARQALQSLKGQGYATRHKGRGTFVTKPKMEKDITHLLGFTAEMQALGMKSSSRVLTAETIAATEEIAERLAVKAGAPIFKLSRLRFADELPVAVEEVCLSAIKFPGIERIDFAQKSLYQTLHERYGVRFGMADEILEARAAGRLEAQLLEIPPRSSLLVISRTLRGVDGEPIEICRSSYRSDRYRAVLRIPATTAV